MCSDWVRRKRIFTITLISDSHYNISNACNVLYYTGCQNTFYIFFWRDKNCVPRLWMDHKFKKLIKFSPCYPSPLKNSRGCGIAPISPPPWIHPCIESTEYSPCLAIICNSSNFFGSSGKKIMLNGIFWRLLI